MTFQYLSNHQYDNAYVSIYIYIYRRYVCYIYICTFKSINTNQCINDKCFGMCCWYGFFMVWPSWTPNSISSSSSSPISTITCPITQPRFRMEIYPNTHTHPDFQVCNISLFTIPTSTPGEDLSLAQHVVTQSSVVQDPSVWLLGSS